MTRTLGIGSGALIMLALTQCSASISDGGAGAEDGGAAAGTGGSAGASGKGGAGGAGGAGGGSSGSAGTSTAGSSGKGGTSGGGSSGKGGTAGKGGTSGSGGKGGTSGSGGSTGGTGGTSGCTPNFACRPAAPASTGNAYEDCVARINQFRACVCLPPLARWQDGESCADQDAAYDRAHNSPHAGFKGALQCSQGWAENECLGGTVNGCIQAMFAEGPPPQNPCTGSCYSAHGHFINMTNTSYSRVACGFAQDWAVQNFE